MTYRGHIIDGSIVLDSPVELPEGASVQIQIIAATSENCKQTEDEPTLHERLQGVVGRAQGLPTDFAAQHDHYIHGAPKR